jgi:hypothetical protein
MQPVSKQRIGKDLSTTLGLLLETVSYIGPFKVVTKKTTKAIQLVECWQFS